MEGDIKKKEFNLKNTLLTINSPPPPPSLQSSSQSLSVPSLPFSLAYFSFFSLLFPLFFLPSPSLLFNHFLRLSLISPSEYHEHYYDRPISRHGWLFPSWWSLFNVFLSLSLSSFLSILHLIFLHRSFLSPLSATNYVKALQLHSLYPMSRTLFSPSISVSFTLSLYSLSSTESLIRWKRYQRAK